MNKLLIVNPRSMDSQMSYLHHLNYLSQNTSLELFLICESVNKELLDERVKLLEVPRYGNRMFYAFKLYKQAAKLIIKQKINWVVSSYGHFNALLVIFLFSARLTKRWTGKLIYDLRSASVSGFMDVVQNKFFSIESQFYDYKIAVSGQAAVMVFGKKKSKECFVSGVGCFPRKDVCNNNDQKKLVEQIREKYGISKDTLVLLYIGTFSKRELNKFIESFEFDNEDFCFFIIGDGDKTSESRLRNVIKQKQLSSKVHLLGRMNYVELPVYLILANVGIAYVPNHRSLTSQPFTKIQEYAEYELIVLASNNLENSQFINSAEVVFLSKYKSISQLKKYVMFNKHKHYKKKVKLSFWANISQQLYLYLKSI